MKSFEGLISTYCVSLMFLEIRRPSSEEDVANEAWEHLEEVLTRTQNQNHEVQWNPVLARLSPLVYAEL